MELIDIATRDADTPLSELGREQSSTLAHWFSEMPFEARPQQILTSPFARAQQTTDYIAKGLRISKTAISVDERLREKEFGVLDRYTQHGILARFPELAAQRNLVGKFYFRPPGGESWCDVILRARSIVEVLRRDHVNENVLIISHQVLVNCFRYLLEGLNEAEILAIDRAGDVSNCGVTEYSMRGNVEGATFALVRANYTLPLRDSGTPITNSSDVPGGPR